MLDFCLNKNYNIITTKKAGTWRKEGNSKEAQNEINKDEIKIVKNWTIYEIRLMVDSEEKETFTKEEILKLLDAIARAKETE